MSGEFLDFVDDILDGMQKAELLLEDISYQEFEDDFRINFAVVRALEIIGEATSDFPISFGRNILIYLGEVWRVCATGSSMDMIR